jgi:predicted transcriptional regulator
MMAAWTIEQDHTVEAQYPHRKAADIARDLGKSAQAVRARAWLLGLTGSGKERGGVRYSVAECELVLAEYAYKTQPEIARERNMTRDQIQWMIHRAMRKKAPAGAE